jgi:hypothetical protein
MVHWRRLLAKLGNGETRAASVADNPAKLNVARERPGPDGALACKAPLRVSWALG